MDSRRIGGSRAIVTGEDSEPYDKAGSIICRERLNEQVLVLCDVDPSRSVRVDEDDGVGGGGGLWGDFALAVDKVAPEISSGSAA